MWQKELHIWYLFGRSATAMALDTAKIDCGQYPGRQADMFTHIHPYPVDSHETLVREAQRAERAGVRLEPKNSAIED